MSSARIALVLLTMSCAALAQSTVYTVAGNGNPGYSGDGGLATSAQVNFPTGIWIDSAGNLFIADYRNHRVRKVSSDGVITTIAGTGVAGYSGDGGPATSAQFDYPYGVTADAAGNLYIADSDNNRVRRVAPGGMVTTLAGTGPGGYSGDGTPAASTLLYLPTDVARDDAGNLYIAEMYGRVRKVSSDGIISTVAGTGIAGYSGDGGPAVSARVSDVSALFLDRSGNLYLADRGNHRIRKVSAAGIITTVAGNGVSGFSGDGGPATTAQLNGPCGVTVDSAGNIYIADTANYRVRKVSPNGVIGTVAGNGYQAFSGDGGPATSAQIGNPFGLALSSSGDLYISDVYNSRVRVIRTNPSTTPLSIITESPLPQGTVGVGYSQTLSVAGGSSPYSWSMVSGALPAGLTFASGAVSGTPSAAGTYSFTVQVRDSASATVSRNFSLTIGSGPSAGAPVISAGGIVNAASNAAGQPITAGSLISIYGRSLAASTAQSASIPLPTSLNNVSVTFNNMPAPLVFVAPGQINAQVPWEVLPGGTLEGDVTVVVTSSGIASAPATAHVGPFSPGVFALNYGTGNAIAINPDGSLAAPLSTSGVAAHPARAGDPGGLIILATGLGALDSYPATGNNSLDKARRNLTTPELLIGGVPAPVLFSGASPQFVGVNQINITLPGGTPTGDAVPLQLRSGGITSTNRVSIAVAECCDSLVVTPPDSLKVTGMAGQLAPSSYTITYIIQNGSALSLPYTLAVSSNWVSISKTGGTLSPNQRDSFTVSLNANANSLGAGTYATTVTLTEKMFGTTITRGVSLDLSAGACMNIAGQWVTTEKGTLTCTVTVNGESDTETDPINSGDLITISQQGCQVSYTSPSIAASFGSGQPVRQGQVDGANVTFSGLMGQPAAGFTYERNLVEESGTVQNNVITLTGTGTLIGSGVWQGMNTKFSCTATTTATMTKWK